MMITSKEIFFNNKTPHILRYKDRCAIPHHPKNALPGKIYYLFTVETLPITISGNTLKECDMAFRQVIDMLEDKVCYMDAVRNGKYRQLKMHYISKDIPKMIYHLDNIGQEDLYIPKVISKSDADNLQLKVIINKESGDVID